MTNRVAILVTAARKDQLVDLINTTTPEYTVGFTQRVCAAGETDWNVPETHWYCNGESVPDEILAVWQDMFDEEEEVELFVGKMEDGPAFDWALENLGGEGLMFCPQNPNI